jgi:hypothetical protein
VTGQAGDRRPRWATGSLSLPRAAGLARRAVAAWASAHANLGASTRPLCEWARRRDNVLPMLSVEGDVVRYLTVTAVGAALGASALAFVLTRGTGVSAPPITVDVLMPPRQFVQARAPTAGEASSLAIDTEQAAETAALDYLQPQLRSFAGSGMTPRLGKIEYGEYTPVNPQISRSAIPIWIITYDDVPSGYSTDPQSPYNAVGMAVEATTGSVIYEWAVQPPDVDTPWWGHLLNWARGMAQVRR